jgi:hypothetical protein
MQTSHAPAAVVRIESSTTRFFGPAERERETLGWGPR